MDDKVDKILDGLPPKPPRSRLDPHVTLIGEMRRRGRTYREIAHVLAETCGVKTSPSNIYYFVQLRARGGETIESGTSKAPFPQCPFGACDRRQTGIASESASRRCATDRGTQES